MHSDMGYSEALLKGDGQLVKSMIKSELEMGNAPETILNDGLISAMSIIGEKFKTGGIYIPEMLVSAITMKEALKLLEPHLIEKAKKNSVRVLLATVKDDLHDIGKNLVKIIFEGSGFDVIDLGTNISEDDLVRAVSAHSPDIIGLSALLTTTMVNMKTMIDALTEAGLRKDVIIIIGGAPVTQAFADEVGVDAYAPDAYSGVEIAEKLLAKI